jgi:GTPase SAR1 family protein
MGSPEDSQKTVLDICLVSGDRGSGKTSLCLRLLKELQALSIAAGGIICPGIFDTEMKKTGCLACDCGFTAQAAWPKQVPLSPGIDWQAPKDDRTGLRLLGSNRQELVGPSWRHWSFCDSTFTWANQLIIDSLGRSGDITFMDEIGPLETELKAGFAAAWHYLVGLAGSSECQVRVLQLPGQDARIVRQGPLLPVLFPALKSDQHRKCVLVTVRTSLALTLEAWLKSGLAQKPLV